jgi:Tol biopolymer transport system component
VNRLDETVVVDCSTDGKWIFYAARKHLYRLPVEGGTPTELLTTLPEEGVFVPRISPDGSLVAVTYQEGDPVPVGKIGVVPASGGSLRFVAQVPIGTGGLRWSPDGKGLQYLLTRSGATNVWEQPLAGGDARQLTRFTSGRIFSFAWSRDGKQLLLAKGNETSDVILISNFR